MDSFAGNEAREFIPFSLGKEANGQPAQASTENSNVSAIPEGINPNVLEETASTEPVAGTSAFRQQPLPQVSSQELLPSVIKVIEDASSQSSSCLEFTERFTRDCSTAGDLTS